MHSLILLLNSCIQITNSHFLECYHFVTLIYVPKKGEKGHIYHLYSHFRHAFADMKIFVQILEELERMLQQLPLHTPFKYMMT